MIIKKYKDKLFILKMSKKQGKSKKNVFGLVSKLGSLIKKGGNNQDSTESTVKTGSGENETPRKNFNIHISEDNLEVFAVGDEEDEEEEDEEENEIKDSNEKKEKDEKEEISTKQEKNKTEEKLDNNNNNNEETKTFEKENNNNKISNNEEMKKNEMNTNNNSIDVNKEEKEQKDIIKNNINLVEENKENIQINNIINTHLENKINENKKNTEITKEKHKSDLDIPNFESVIKDNSETCHLYLKKGNDFNSNEINCYPIIRNKKKKSVFQKIGFFKKQKSDLVNYKLFFDEYFIYLSKDIIVDKKNVEKRRISNILKIKNIINYSTTKEKNNYRIIIEIINKNGIIKNKELFIEEKYFEAFNKDINYSLKLYGGLHMNKK